MGDCFTERCESMPDGELISVTINDGIKKFSELGRHDNSNDDKSKYKKVCAGDIAYNSMRMWQGASGCSPYEGIVSPAYTVLTPNSGINSKCMAYQFKLPATIHTFKINSQGITSDNWNLKFPALSEIEIYVSPYEQEQAKIAAYFANLDHLITLHQRKYDKLQVLKKAMLEKMFPKNGSSVPEIRFKGFTDAWEQRKLGEVSESYSGGTPSVGVKEYYGGQIPFIRSAEINSEITELFLTEDGLRNSSARLVAVGDILYALYGATSGEVGRARLKGAINQAILAIKPHTDYDSEYLAQWLRKSKHSIIETYLQGGQGNLSGTIVKELLVDFPSLKEQRAIGDFFSQLDHLITLHQRELEKLQNIKKSMLEKMFV